jgi:hypothetical protein
VWEELPEQETDLKQIKIILKINLNAENTLHGWFLSSTAQIPGWKGGTLEGCSTPTLVFHPAASSCYISQMLGKDDISPGTEAEH